MKTVLTVGAVLALLCAVPSAHARELTFKERILAQERIESVYYSHQLQKTKPFGEAVPQAVLEAKVRAYLQQSAALEEVWKTPVTREMLEREVDRIARSTRMPDRLQQLFDALGNDYVLVAECLARPVLVSRVARDFFAYDERIHAGTRRAAEAFRAALDEGRIDPEDPHPARTEVELVLASENGEVEPSAETRTRPGVRTRALPPEELARWRDRLPSGSGRPSKVLNRRDAYVVQVVLEDAPDRVHAAVFSFPKQTWDEWWSRVARGLDGTGVKTVATDLGLLPRPTGVESRGPDDLCVPDDTWANGSLDDVPDPRWGATAVWTGSLMLMWGGTREGVALGTGYRYDPAIDRWSPISNIGAPEPRQYHTAVWTGREMLVWGGSGGGFLGSGGRYDPGTDTWRRISDNDAPSARTWHTAVWTGSRMLIWGGYGSQGYPMTGGKYDPVANVWGTISASGSPPSPRRSHAAVWTGTEMLVWGGWYGYTDTYLDSGARYDIATDRWTAISDTGAPLPRASHVAIWTGDEMVIWGGWISSFLPPFRTNTGGRYDPSTDTWSPTSTANAPPESSSNLSVWTGAEVLILTRSERVGRRYDPERDVWSPISMDAAPDAFAVAVWTGERVIVWGQDSGGRYDPANDLWTPVFRGNAPDGRAGHGAVWTGNHMVVWGGNQWEDLDLLHLDTGGRYDPVTNNWTPTSMADAPPPLSPQATVWTGSEMLVRGTTTGGRYEPITDTWRPMSTVSQPGWRSSYTAVWTGELMIVWGGRDGSRILDTGGIYNPATDTWTPTATLNAPTARYSHSAVWTGEEMVVWGGAMDGSGGRYDPDSDRWTPMTMDTGSVQTRWGHKAVWTGDEMVVWGGGDARGRTLHDGGRYDPERDAWAPISEVGAPMGGSTQSVVWTGRTMLLWGGWDGERRKNTDTGGRYDPANDLWTTTGTVGAPEGRTGHTAVWTGSGMIVWGGYTRKYSGLSLYRMRSGGFYALGHRTDDDGDGASECDGDCNDGNPDVHPDALEICDSLDNDCNGATDDTLEPIVCPEDIDLECGIEPDPDRTGRPVVVGGCGDVLVEYDDASLGGCGLTEVITRTWAAVDQVGNRSTCTQTISIIDRTPPTVSAPPPISLECSTLGGVSREEEAIESWIAVAGAQDSCGHADLSSEAPALFPVGSTEVSFVAVDECGNETMAASTVTVRDTTPPALTLELSPDVLWPPDHRLVDIRAVVRADDVCSLVDVRLLSITSDEPDDATGRGDGQTIGDIQGDEIGTPDWSFRLRAERAGSGDGRVYAVVYGAADASGNTNTVQARVSVPHNSSRRGNR